MKRGELRESPSSSILAALGGPTMPGKAAKVIVTERQLAALQKMAASSTCRQGVAQRARMITLAFAGQTIKRGNFTSVKDLRDKLLAFIAYFNEALAKPFKWTYTGRPLNV
jgi:hypothetical protein